MADDPGCGCSDDSGKYGWGGNGGGMTIEECSVCPAGNVTTCSYDGDGDGTVTKSEQDTFNACHEEQLALGRETRCTEPDFNSYCDPDGGGAGGAGGSGGAGGAGGSGGSGGATATSAGSTSSTGTGSAVDRRSAARARSRTAHTACPQKPLQHDRGAWPAMLTFGAAASVVALRSVRRRPR